MHIGHLLIIVLTSSVTISIRIPEESDYHCLNFPLRIIVETDEMYIDSVRYSINNDTPVVIEKSNTDWYTYMCNDSHSGYSESIAPDNDRLLWTAPVTGVQHEFPTPVVVDGVVFYPSDYGTDSLYALDALTGEVIWRYHVGVTDDAVTVKDNRVYIASDSIWCLSAESGERLWAFGEANGSGSTPVVTNGRVFCARYEREPDEKTIVYSLDAVTGEVIWESTVGFMCLSCMTSWNGLLFVPTWGSNKFPIRFRPLYALDCETGDTVWINISSPYGYWDSSPVIDNGRLYIAGFQGTIHAINANSGNTLWIRQVTEGECLPCLHRADITATLAFHQGKLFFADQYDYFYCLDAETGETLWRVPGSQHGSPALADGIVFFGEHYRQEGSRVIALNVESGDEIWSYETGNTQIFSSPAISNGIMYIAGTDNNLYAFGTGYKFLFSDSVTLEEGTNTITIEAIHDDRIVSLYTDSIMTTY
jgi:eukaryotic-like serine/threonine-protein kinase